MKGEPQPRICGTIAVQKTRLLRPAAEAAISQGADLLEFRFDYLETTPGNDELNWLEDIELPKIATVRSMDEGGAYRGPEEKRIQLLKRFSELCEIVDIEFSSAQPDLISGLGGRAQILISHHDFSSTPSRDRLLSLVSRSASRGARHTKLATKVSGPKEVLRLLRISSEVPNVVAIPMGRAGRLGRIMAPMFGSEHAYAHPVGFPPVAPGMISIRDMRMIYGRLSGFWEPSP